MKLGLAALVCAALVAAGGSRLAAEQEPSPAPIKWELNFRPAPLQRLSIGGRTYWCLVYKVVNNTGEDVDFLPEFERVSEVDNEMTLEQIEKSPGAAPTLIVEKAIVGADASVFQSIKQLHARTYPLMVSPVNVIGRILQGLDNARESVAIFPELKPGVGRFTIYVGGLSGERRVIANPAWKPVDGKAGTDGRKTPRQFVIQKTLALPYTMAGDPQRPGVVTPTLGEIKWVMR